MVFTGIFAVCLTVRRPSSWFRLALALTIAVVVALLVAAPWYIAMEHAHPGYLYYYFVERHLQGYLTATQRHAGRPFWYYLPIVLGGALPWSGYLVGAARFRQGYPPSPRSGFGEASGGASSERRVLRLVLWGWFAIGLVFLSIGESKLVTYALPLFPILGLIVGEYFATRPGGFHIKAEDAWFKLGFAIQVLAMALLPTVGLLILHWKFGTVPFFLWVAPAVFSLLTIDAGRRAIDIPVGIHAGNRPHDPLHDHFSDAGRAACGDVDDQP